MKLLHSSLALAALFTLVTDTQDQKILEHGRTCYERFFSGELQKIWDECDDGMRKTLVSLDNLKMFREQVATQLGSEVSMVEETTQTQAATAIYTRKSRFEKVPMVIETIFGFDQAGKISTMLVRPVPTAAPSEFLEYQTKTELRLPFDDEWFVFWGGRTIEQNYHAVSVDQRFAYDILMVKDNSSHTGDGKRNEDYYCFERPLLAPGAGVVVVAVDGVEDNAPGEMNPRQAAGNHVILDHGNGEYSLLAHFKKGTLAVKEGDRVASGDELGLCGNSGNSSEPHLHYHLQNAPEFGKGQGLPAQFQGYVADGTPVERGEPVKGQRVRVPEK